MEYRSGNGHKQHSSSNIIAGGGVIPPKHVTLQGMPSEL